MSVLLDAPDYLLIGHVTRDLFDHGWRPGGTVTFAGRSAAALGRKIGIVTSCRLEDFDSKLPGAHLIYSSEQTTTFQNIHSGDLRSQVLSAVAGKVGPREIPPDWRRAEIVHLGPLAGEISPRIAVLFPESLVLANLQGWLRRIGPDGAVSPKNWPPNRSLAGIAVAIASEADFRDEEKSIAALTGLVPVLVVTQGKLGATVFENGREHVVPAYPAIELDTVGAGDVFSAAFAVKYHQTNNAVDAADFAGAAAAIAVEETGAGRYANRDRIEERRGRRIP